MERVIVTRAMVGICHMQVCAEADVTDEEILKTANRENPSGTTQGWCEVIREGDGAPVVCAEYPERWHFMLVC